MTHKVYTEWNAIQEAKLYPDSRGDLYLMPETRAELVRHLCFQRRRTQHLADAILFITRDQGAQS